MSSAALTQYYQLCTLSNGGRSHPAKKLSPEGLAELFGERAFGVYFLETPTEMVSAEKVIGGDEDCSQPVLFLGSD